jgi:hypothetical protein
MPFILRLPSRPAALAVLVASLSLTARTSAQGAITPNIERTARSGAATVIAKAPIIDGHLDEEVWKSGEPFTGFIQRELNEGQPSTERTEVRILTDGEALYVGAWLFDREPQNIVPGEKIRDATLTNSDYFGFILDTYLDRQNGFIFSTTPAGVEYDAQVVKEGEGGGVFQTGQSRAQSGAMGGFNLNWDATWKVATSIDANGWYAEFRIPFSTLRYAGGQTQTWGLNLVRSIRRRNEESFWSFVPRQFSLMRLSRAGTLTGIDVPVRRVATLTPYVLSAAARDYVAATPRDYTGEWGIDAKLGVTPSLTLDLTYNTDFAQVEVDEQRTNLTRFPLFFPEKRPFFLENAGVFSAGTPQAVDFFFTRRIGIDSLGNPVPIIGGGRLTGRIAGLTLGALEIVTDETPGVQPTTSYTVGRVTKELSARSRVGLIAVQRLASGNSDDVNRTYGADGRIGVGEAWTFDWWGAKTQTPERSGNDFAYNGRAAYQTDRWSNSLRYTEVGEDFNPEVGFLNRLGGYRFYEASVMRLVRDPDLKWLKQWNPHFTYRGYYNLDGYYSSGQMHIDLTEVEFAGGGRFGPELNIYHEGLQQPFEIASGRVLPVGSYNFTGIGLDWSSNPSSPLSFVLRGDFGPFYNGTRNGGNTTITYRQGASLTTSLLLDYNDVRLDQGSFTRSLVGTRVGYFFTPKLFFQSLVQYNNQARVWNANARIGWLNTAGTGLFIVYNEGQEANGFFDWVRPQARSFVVKYTRQIG